MSKNVTPASRAARTAPIASSRSIDPQSPPNCQVPKQIRETFSPLLPSRVYLTARPAPCRRSGRRRRRRAGRPRRAPRSCSSRELDVGGGGVLLEVARAAWCRGSARRRRPGAAATRAPAGPACSPPRRRSRATRSTRSRLCSRLPSWKRGEVRRKSSSAASMLERRRSARRGRAGCRARCRRPARARSGRSRASSSRVNSDHSLCSAAIGCTASAARSVSALTSHRPRCADLARLRPARPWRRRSPRSARPGCGGACSRGRSWSTPRRRREASQRLADPLGAVVDPARRRLSRRIAELGGQLHLVAAAGDRLADELLVVAGAVHVGGVEERHAEVERAVDRRDRLGLVGWAVELGHPHAAEADGGHGQVS